MKFLKGFYISAFSNILIVFFAFFNNVIITRQLGPEGRGKYTVLINLILLLTLFLGEGIRRSNTIIIGKNRSEIKNLIFTTIIYSVLLLLVLIIFYLIRDLWIALIPNIEDPFIILSFLTIIFAVLWQAFQAILLGVQRYYEFNIIQLLATVITFFVNFIGIYFFNYQLYEILLSLLIATIISFIYGLFTVRENIKISQIRFITLPNRVKILSLKSTVSAGFIFILLKSNIFIINYLLGSVEAGLYSIAYVFLDMTQKLPNVATPIFISKAVSDEKDTAIFNTMRLVRVVFTINIFIVIFLALFGKWIIITLFKEEFLESYYLLLYLLPAVLFLGVGAIIYSYYMSNEYPLKIIIINAIFALSSLIINYILIIEFKTVGASLAISITFVSWALVLLIYFVINNKLNFIEMFKITNQDLQYIFGFLKRKNSNV